MARSSSKLEGFAEDLGRLLGTAQNKAQGWLGQRKQIAKSLEGIRDTATTLLNQLAAATRHVASMDLSIPVCHARVTTTAVP